MNPTFYGKEFGSLHTLKRWCVPNFTVSSHTVTFSLSKCVDWSGSAYFIPDVSDSNLGEVLS